MQTRIHPFLRYVFGLYNTVYGSIFRARKISTDDIDFTDRPYQLTLPMHARSTASQVFL